VYTAATPAAPAYWLHSDWLGSARLSSSPGQTVLTDQAYAPFAEDYDVYFHGGSHEFTGQTQDVASGIYDFLFRQYSPTQGRWMVPDPAGRAAVDITNPQTWNRYAYVANNPLNAVDPLGLFVNACFSLDPTSCSGSLDYGGSGWWSYDSSQGVGSPGTGSTSGGSGTGNSDTPNLDAAAAEIEHFFGGQFSGIWGQTQLNNYEAQQTFSVKDENGTALLAYLPQNQNPIAQSAIWESQYIKDLPQTWASIITTNPITGKTTTTSTPVYIAGPGLPEPTTFTLAKAPSLNGCLAQYSKAVNACRTVYPEGSSLLMSCVQAAQRSANAGCPGLKPFP